MSDDRDLLAAVLESTSALVVVLGRDGTVLKFNRACELVSGHRFDEIRGLRLEDVGLIPETEQASGPHNVVDPDPRVYPRSHEGVWQTRTGERRFLTWTETPIVASDGSIEAVVRTGVDVTERRRAERRLATQFETLRVLTSAQMAEEAIVLCLEAITRGLSLDVGEYWTLDETAGLLTLAKTWHAPRPELEAFERASREFTFSKGQGLPGRIWDGSSTRWWVEDLAQDPEFLRQSPAAVSGLRGGFGFPVADGDALLGVMTFFTAETLSSDPALMTMLTGLGGQIGEFLRRRRTEERLARSESRSAAILEAALDGMIFTDEQGRILEFNRAAEVTFGLIRDDVLGKPMAELILTVESREIHRRALSLALTPGLASGSRKPVELRARKRNGEVFPAEVTVVPFQLDDHPGLTCCFRDLSERKSTEKSLRESEERLGTVITEAPVILFTLDPQGIITLAKGKALSALGLAGADLVGKTIFDLYPDNPKALAGLRRALKGEAFVVRTDVGDVSLEGHYSPLRGPAGENRGVIGVALDITERRRTEERLRMFAALVENSGDFIAMADSNGRVNYINPAGRALVGLNGQDALIDESIYHHFDGPTQTLLKTQALPAVMVRGSWAGPGRVLNSQTQSTIDVQISLFLVREPDSDHSLCLAAILRDMTERSRVEEELTRARDAAEAGSRAKSEFLANMSHEIRTPLTAILGSADMLQDRALSKDLHVQALGNISRNGQHLLQIINNLLDLSKLEAERAKPECSMVSAAAILAEVLSALNVQAREKALELSATSLGKIPRLFWTDPTRLRQILFNLISNAIKFTNEGKIEVKLRFEPATAATSGVLVIDVKDEGIGMTPEQIANLFTPFYQADTSHTRVFGGTGLGLNVAERLAESLGAEILVESSVGVGSRFSLRLPTTIDHAAGFFNPDDDLFAVIGSRFSVHDSRAVTLNGAQVLLVEDSRDNQRVVSYYLQRLGLSIEIAENGRLAVDMAMKRAYDLILMDMQMPELDGYGATRLLRSSGYEAPIVALTAHAMTGDAEKCLEAGCDDYLRKPVEWERLASVLHRFLEKQGGANTPGDVAPAAEKLVTSSSSSDDESPLVSDFAGDLDFLDLIRDYVGDLSVQLDEIYRSLHDRDLETVKSVAHKLKGSAGMYGYWELTEVAGVLEDAIRENRDIDLIVELVEVVAAIVRRIERGLPLSAQVNPDGYHNA